MRLNGVYAPPGTVIGIHFRDQRFLVADVCDTSDLQTRTLPLRWARADEVAPHVLRHREPNSVTEHQALATVSTPYGRAKVIGVDPTPVEIVLPDIRDVQRQARKILKSVDLRPGKRTRRTHTGQRQRKW